MSKPIIRHPRRSRGPRRPIQHVVNLSGGKDSTATALVCLATQPREQITLLFADTGNEHPITYEYIDYLAEKLDMPVTTVKADFTEQFAHKYAFVEQHWERKGVAPEFVESALDVLSKPTGIPFLDLCIWKGRFPSSRARFCTTELKVLPIVAWQMQQVATNRSWLWSWQGIRADESRARLHMHECEDLGDHIMNYRPILKWPVEAVFEAAKSMGIDPNPLYKQGMTRVGCMPCIFTRKNDIKEIAKRWPEVIDRIEQWESVLRACNKTGFSSFFMPRDKKVGRTSEEIYADGNIREIVEWANTDFGGKQHKLDLDEADLICTSAYGLCE